MSNYTKTVDFAAKDALVTGTAAKAGRGTEVNTEFANIATAIATKEDTTNKGAAGGYAALDSSSKISSSALPIDIVPQNLQSANYTLVIGDANKQICHASGAGAGDTYTIPANASVAFSIGTVVTFVNLDSNTVAIVITSDTMTIAGTTTTGARTLAQNGVAQALKVTSTSWLIMGTGLT